MKLANLKYYLEFLFFSITFVVLFVLSIITINEVAGPIYDYFKRHETVTFLLASIIFITPVNIFFYWLLSKDVSPIIKKVQHIFLRLLFLLSILIIIFLAFGLLLSILQANLLMTDLKIGFLSSIPVFILAAITFFGIRNQVSFRQYSFVITLLTLVVIVFGFLQIDSPAKYHAIETDYENFTSLVNGQYGQYYGQYPFPEVLKEYNHNLRLPESLSDDNKPKYSINTPVYARLNNDSFSLCLNFKYDSPIIWGDSAYEEGNLYSIGEGCFQYTMQCDWSRNSNERLLETINNTVGNELETETEEKSCSKYEIYFNGMI